MPDQQLQDEQILMWMKDDQQSERGFRLLLQKYQERLYWHIRRMVTEHEDANDVLQNCLIKIFRNIRQFEGKSQLYTWLYRIATNEAITFLTQKKRQQVSSLDNDESHLANKLRADAFFDGNEVQIQLQLALERLPEKQRLVFQLRYFDEMNYHDMSEMLGTSVGALKASFHHAVKKVETYLSGVQID